MRANTGSMGVWSIVVLPSASPAAAESGRPLVDAVLRALLKKSVDLNVDLNADDTIRAGSATISSRTSTRDLLRKLGAVKKGPEELNPLESESQRPQAVLAG